MCSVVLLVVACVRKSEKECICARCRHCANVYDTDTDTVDCFAKFLLRSAFRFNKLLTSSRTLIRTLFLT